MDVSYIFLAITSIFEIMQALYFPLNMPSKGEQVHSEFQDGALSSHRTSKNFCFVIEMHP